MHEPRRSTPTSQAKGCFFKKKSSIAHRCTPDFVPYATETFWNMNRIHSTMTVLSYKALLFSQTQHWHSA
uniref:Uncharacterized protein n=1 Tax=Setaria italica TaxID=4555 RepID=K4AHM7_SETIT